MIKRSFFFVLGFALGIAILYWPRKDVEVLEEEYDAHFTFSIDNTNDLIIDYLSRAGYTYVGPRALTIFKTTQWEFNMKNVPARMIREHYEKLLQLGVEPGVKITRKSDDKVLPWV